MACKMSCFNEVDVIYSYLLYLINGGINRNQSGRWPSDRCHLDPAWPLDLVNARAGDVAASFSHIATTSAGAVMALLAAQPAPSALLSNIASVAAPSHNSRRFIPASPRRLATLSQHRSTPHRPSSAAAEHRKHIAAPATSETPVAK